MSQDVLPAFSQIKLEEQHIVVAKLHMILQVSPFISLNKGFI